MKFTSEEGAVLTGTSILVVEDEPLLQELMCAILSELGAACSAFANAEDGLMALLKRQGDYSLVIVDHSLPGDIKGLELAAMVRQRWPTTPTLITSGHALRSSDLGADQRFLMKPWSVQQLTAAVFSALDGD
nr:response regulator [uncultured Pseudomonas sp.]